MENKDNSLIRFFKPMSQYNVIGVMSGTSLDGIDVCYSSFTYNQEKKQWDYEIHQAHTFKLEETIKHRLQSIVNGSAIDLSILNNDYGNLIGKCINTFINDYSIKRTEVDFIASHGHTIFHQPEINLTLQIGNGANITTRTKIPVICDFRTNDIALNGQGAPLVPIGDKFLFSEFDYCINLGGIGNISKYKGNDIIAYDMCPANMVLNHLAQQINLEYDMNGDISRKGEINQSLLNELNQINYYQQQPPKSLGYEWVSDHIYPILSNRSVNTEDKLRTFTEHIAIQIGKILSEKNTRTLITGGGAHNNFLMERIRFHAISDIVKPNDQTIDYKEALIFGFLGVLRWRKEINTLKSVTGSSADNVGGSVYFHQ